MKPPEAAGIKAVIVNSSFAHIYELVRTEWYVLSRAHSRDHGTDVLLKTAPNTTQTLGSKLLEREHQLLQSVTAAPTPRVLKLQHENGETCLILEDTGALPLASVIALQRSELTTVLAIAIRLVAVLEDLHRRHITALHLHPHCILVHPTTHKVCLIDLSLASHGRNDENLAPSPFSLPSLLPYISPEQTGRMNRAVDYRTDLYSLGVILYEMLTGNCPFRSHDPLEVLHWLLAKVPPPPAEANPAVPEPFSQIVMKLLAKEAGERYQSTIGLKHDLERCFAEWTAHQQVATFPLGQRDVSDRFMIPQKLYGREREVEALRLAFTQALTSKEPVLLLVSGAAGSGKTSLVRELYRPLTRERGYFLNSKCDQFVSKPYDVILQILVDTIRQVLMQPEELQQYWRSLFMRAGGANLGVMTEMVPEMELIVGKQPPPPPLSSIEAHQRFRMVFQTFTWTFMRSDHPLGVMLLDDLQWVDADSVSLLPSLLATDVHSAFYIGVYRDNEVDEHHPLTQLVHTLQATGISIVRVHVGPLALPDLTALVMDTLHCDPAVAEPVARLIEQKTGGNPFFVKQFLTALHADGYFTFDYERGQWTFDLERIATAAITDNVVDLLVTRLQEFSPLAARTLSLAACIGNRFDLATLATVSEQAVEHTRHALSEGLDHGMLISTADGVYTFAHDRIQQAAYAVIPEEQKPATHLTIGRLLRDRGVTDDNIFAVVQHLNRGHTLIGDPAERRGVAVLNMRAGHKAKATSAYAAALAYCQCALDVAASLDWGTEHEFLFAVHLLAAECAILEGEFANADTYFARLSAHAQTRREHVLVYDLRIVQSLIAANFSEALVLGREALALFEITLPTSQEELQVAIETLAAACDRLLEEQGGIATLQTFPEMRDEEMRTLMRLLYRAQAPATLTNDRLTAVFLSTQMMHVTLRYGASAEAGFGLVGHGIYLRNVHGLTNEGYELGRMGTQFAARLDALYLRGCTQWSFATYLCLWRLPWRDCIAEAQQAADSAAAGGDVLIVPWAEHMEVMFRFLATTDLVAFLADIESIIARQTRLTNPAHADLLRVVQAWALALRDETGHLGSLSLPGLDAAEFMRRYAAYDHQMATLYIAQLHLAVLGEMRQQALEAIQQFERVRQVTVATVYDPYFDVLSALGHATAHHTASAQEQAESRAYMVRCRDRLRSAAEANPTNFRCWSLLVSAELARIGGQIAEAMSRYQEGLAFAHQTGSLHDASLGNELYARFWFQRGNEEIARLYFTAAAQCYEQWGARAKVRDLAGTYGALLIRREMPLETGNSVHTESTPIHLLALTKAASTLVSEIELEGLLRKMLSIAQEYAGVQRGCIIEEHDGHLYLMGEGSVDTEQPAILQRTPIETYPHASHTVIRYVYTTGEAIILDDATTDERFSHDPYIVATRPRSLICGPIMHQGVLKGIFYGENNLITGAFSQLGLEVLQFLAAQSAIALENARLYAEMKQEVQRRRQAEEDLRAALVEVEALKNRLQVENVYLQEEIRQQHNFENIVGNSPALLNVLRQVEQVAATNATVLVLGETGTGKELIARAIHDRSPRQDRPLVKVNCAAISAGLVESELFGHVKGAFTGAIDRRVGRFEVANGGTVFLDEVGELPLETQAKLLRVLQEQEFEPVGSNKAVHVDVRVVAATNRNLEDEVKAGRFRADLFYRLNVFPVAVPALRTRREDIAQLVMFFLTRYAKQFGKHVDSVAKETMSLLEEYPWPGNIRELQNLIERAVVLNHGSVLTIDKGLLPETVRVAPVIPPELVPQPIISHEHDSPASSSSREQLSLEELERRHIIDVLKQTKGVVEGPRGAAVILNLHPNTLRSRMKKLGIKRGSYDIS